MHNFILLSLLPLHVELLLLPQLLPLALPLLLALLLLLLDLLVLAHPTHIGQELLHNLQVEGVVLLPQPFLQLLQAAFPSLDVGFVGEDGAEDGGGELLIGFGLVVVPGGVEEGVGLQGVLEELDLEGGGAYDTG